MSNRKEFSLHPGPNQLYAPLVSRFALMDVTRWLTLNASTPAWMTGAKTVSLSLESANMSGIWSRRLQRRGAQSQLGLFTDTLCTSTHSQTGSHLVITAFDSW